MSGKIGRNQPCPCGSSKKYKRCHGDTAQMDRVRAAAAAAQAQLPLHFAREQRRVEQQGRGHPIVSMEFHDHRLVAVGNRLHYGPKDKTKTFADFLIQYVGSTLGAEWCNAELAKPEAQMHPIALWYRTNALHQRRFAGKPGEIFSAPENGAARALLELGYNLYLLEHNAELRSRFVDRLKHRDQFLGALSELRIAGIMVRAGYDIEFEDDAEVRRTHCEYNVTRKTTKRRFSVEVKTRHWPTFPVSGADGQEQVRVQVRRQVRNALAKQAEHDRIVFIELAMPDRADGGIKEPWWMSAAKAGVQEAERLLAEQGQVVPEAIVVVANHPHQFHLDVTDSVVGFVLSGTGGSDFTGGEKTGPLREAVQFHRRHADFLGIWKSIRDYRRIPSTFDGSNPHLAYGDHPPPFQIGTRYKVPGPDGSNVVAVLEEAVALTGQKLVHGIYRTEDGRRFHVTGPMTDAEIRAYQEHPDTFFGVVKPQGKVHGPLEMFDFLYQTYKNAPKEQLLAFLAGAGSRDLETLRKLSQEDLATEYCVRMADALCAATQARQPSQKKPAG